MTYQSDPPLWFEVFQELMCRLYKAFGGDCSDLDWGDGEGVALQTVRSAFEEEGPPFYESPRESDRFFSNLDAIEAHLDAPEVTISSATAAGIRRLVEEIRAASVL